MRNPMAFLWDGVHHSCCMVMKDEEKNGYQSYAYRRTVLWGAVWKRVERNENLTTVMGVSNK